MSEQTQKRGPFSRSYAAYLLAFLGAMSAFGPFVTDMYLPSLPAMTKEFAATVAEVQSGISTSLIGLAVGQFLFGPLSDKYGRRPLMVWPLVMFCLATVADIFAPTITTFNVFRFFQGVGGAGGIVLSRSVATDCYSGRDLVRTMAIIAAINGVAPVTAPLVGGFVSASFGWKGVFVVLLGIGVSLLAMTARIHESLPREARFKGTYAELYGGFIRLLRDRVYLGFVLISALANGVLFSYIASSSFIVQSTYGIGEMTFGIIFGINAVAIMVGSALSLKFSNLLTGIWIGGAMAAVCVLILVGNSMAIHNFWIYESATWVCLFGLGMILPSVSSLAMDSGRYAIGAASALLGGLGFAMGGIVSPLCGLGDMNLTSAALMAACALLLLVCTRMASHRL